MIRDHLFPKTIEEAVHLLETFRGKARVLAGGTDLIIDIRNKEFDFEVLVDTANITRLRSLEEEDGKVFIGAAVTFTELETHRLVKDHFLALSQAAGTVGGPQIRNRGTLGGNIVSAQPAADGALALFAFDATIEIAGPHGVREIPIREAYHGLGQSKINPTQDLLVGIRMKKRKAGEGSNYQRVSVRRAMQLPILACAVSLKTRDLRVDRARVALGPVANTPFRAEKVEAFLKGRFLGEEIFEEAGEVVSQDVNPRDSKLRGSRDYRKKLAAVLVKRGLREAASDSAKPGAGHVS
jgi:CO/xanthine dehydrogenase FAD-binding subunit